MPSFSIRLLVPLLPAWQATLLLLLLSIILLPPNSNNIVVHGYPLVAQVPEGAEKCFKFNIPEDDDAHMVFLALPMGETIDDAAQNIVESWFVQEIYDMTKQKFSGGNLPKRLLNEPPDRVQEKMNKLDKGSKSNNKLKLVVATDANNPTSRILPVNYFVPTVINKVRESHKKIRNRAAPTTTGEGEEAKKEDEEEEENEDDDDLSGFSVCFDNSDSEDEQVQVIMDIVMLSSEVEEEPNEPNFVKEKHLSPLEESLDKSIKAANTVLREMKYMTDREERMRVTADSINQRVQYFSIISVVILLAVTYIQVTYLKRYFKKKKLM